MGIAIIHQLIMWIAMGTFAVVAALNVGGIKVAALGLGISAATAATAGTR